MGAEETSQCGVAFVGEGERRSLCLAGSTLGRDTFEQLRRIGGLESPEIDGAEGAEEGVECTEESAGNSKGPLGECGIFFLGEMVRCDWCCCTSDAGWTFVRTGGRRELPDSSLE